MVSVEGWTCDLFVCRKFISDLGSTIIDMMMMMRMMMMLMMMTRQCRSTTISASANDSTISVTSATGEQYVLSAGILGPDLQKQILSFS